ISLLLPLFPLLSPPSPFSSPVPPTPHLHTLSLHDALPISIGHSPSIHCWPHWWAPSPQVTVWCSNHQCVHQKPPNSWVPSCPNISTHAQLSPSPVAKMP